MSQDEDNSWKSAKYREGITWKLEEALQESGRMPFITSSYIENLIFEDASNKGVLASFTDIWQVCRSHQDNQKMDEYLNYVAKWILQLRAPPRAVTPEQNLYLPSILQLTLPQRTVVPEDTLQESMSQVAVPDDVSHSTVQEFLPQPTGSDVEWQKPMQEKSPKNSERRSEIRRSPSRIKKKSKKKNWKSNQFRQNMISKLNAAMERSGIERNITSADIEGLIFKNAKTKVIFQLFYRCKICFKSQLGPKCSKLFIEAEKDEYLDNVAKWILRIGDR